MQMLEFSANWDAQMIYGIALGRQDLAEKDVLVLEAAEARQVRHEEERKAFGHAPFGSCSNEILHPAQSDCAFALESRVALPNGALPNLKLRCTPGQPNNQLNTTCKTKRTSGAIFVVILANPRHQEFEANAQ